MPFGNLIKRINRWLAPAAAGGAVDPASSAPARPAALGVQVMLGEIEEAEQGEQTPEERESSE
jgi:hypothetical protein